MATKPKSKKSHLFNPPIILKFGQNSKPYYISDGNKPFKYLKDAKIKAERLRKDKRLCRVVKMNTEYYIYSRTK